MSGVSQIILMIAMQIKQIKKVKQKKCIICKGLFIPSYTSAQRVCSLECAKEAGSRKTEKDAAKQKSVERKQLKEAKLNIKPRSKWLAEAQAVFNKYIRLRDAKDPCISCGRHHTGQYHAGHYRSVGANPELRFNELNCHKQCSSCNTHLSGNLIEYRINLIRKIGLASVMEIESKHNPLKLTIDDIKEIKRHYQHKCRELEND